MQSMEDETEPSSEVMKKRRLQKILSTKGNGFLKFIWNPSEKEFCGRSGCSWLRITLFYIIFYLLLAGFSKAMFSIFLLTVDLNIPKWQLDSSCIGSNPGLGFRPFPDDGKSTLFWFKNESAADWRSWVDSLDEYLKPYRGEGQFNDLLRSCDFDIHYLDEHVCAFALEALGNYCTKQNSFGYDVGKPCILLKLNRIYGWEPVQYTNNSSLPSTMPQHIKKVYDPNYVYISCEGKKEVDKEYIGPVRYYPENGAIPKYYFPFMNTKGYLSPFVFIHFQNAAKGVLINIECKAWAANIKHDRANQMGSVQFELLLDNKE